MNESAKACAPARDQETTEVEKKRDGKTSAREMRCGRRERGSEWIVGEYFVTYRRGADQSTQRDKCVGWLEASGKETR